MDRFTITFLSWCTICFVSVVGVFPGGAIDAVAGRSLPSAEGDLTGPTNRPLGPDFSRRKIDAGKGRDKPEYGRPHRPIGPLFPWGTIWYSQINDSRADDRSSRGAAKQQYRPSPIVLNPDIFNPQPKDPKIIELGDGNYEKGFRAYNAGDYAVAYELLSTETRYSVVKATLGFMFFSGLGVIQDYSKALEWFIEAAQQGNVVAQKNVGTIYAGGYGVPRDYREAARWYLMAAENNDAVMQKRLADMYILGLGVPADKLEAVKWYRRASENGLESAGQYAKLFVDHDLGYCSTVLSQDLGLNNNSPLGIDDAVTD